MRVLFIFLTLITTAVSAANYQFLYEFEKLGPFYCNVENANQNDPAVIMTNCKYLLINGDTAASALAGILNEGYMQPQPTSFKKYKSCEKAILVVVHSKNKNVKISCQKGDDGRPQF